MNNTTHRHAHERKPPSPAPRPWAYPPRSLLGVGVGARLGLATLASGVLWLTVWWAMN